MSLSALSQKISVQLAQDILAGELPGGTHVGAQHVAEKYGVSRTPVREALNQLADKGALLREVNRGYFVADSPPEALVQWLKRQSEDSADDYQRMADDWLTDDLPEEVTEKYLRDRYGLTKSRVADLLMRAAREGWAERKEGYGWRFLPVAKTAAAFEEIYRFRMAIEPAALLEPSFELDRAQLDEQKRIQSGMLEASMEHLSDERILQNGAAFHEAIIRMANNPYFFASLQRVNRMRRLMEYRTKVDRERSTIQCTEHLALVDLLERGELAEASYFMRRHLSGALERKSPIAWSWLASSKSK